MSAKRIGWIFCFILVLFYAFKGARILSIYGGISDPSGLGPARAVGAFLPSFVLLIVGLWLFKKSKKQ